MTSESEGAADGGRELPTDPDLGTGADGGGARWARGRLLAAIAAGGFAGGLARYGIDLAVPVRHGGFPAATFAINVAGSFVLALLVVFVLEILPPTTYVRPLLGVGFCGALTTFSTWVLDADRLVGAGHYGTAAADLFGSLAAGLAATSLGLTVGRAIVAHRSRRGTEGEPELVGAV